MFIFLFVVFFNNGYLLPNWELLYNIEYCKLNSIIMLLLLCCCAYVYIELNFSLNDDISFMHLHKRSNELKRLIGKGRGRSKMYNKRHIHVKHAHDSTAEELKQLNISTQNKLINANR